MKEASRLETKQGVRFVYLNETTPYETGLLHGRLLRDEIQVFIDQLESFAGSYISPKMIGKGMLKLLRTFAWTLLRTFPATQQQELKGISDGCKQDISWIIFANTIHDVLAVKLLRNRVTTGCSAAITTTQKEGLLMTKLTDLYVTPELSNILASHRFVFVHQGKWLSQPFLTTAFTGCLAGDIVVRKNGLAFTVNDGGTMDKKLVFRNRALLSITRTLAEEAVTTDAIIDGLKKNRTMKSYTFLVTDGSKQGSLIVDTCNGDIGITKLDTSLFNVNRFHSQELIDNHFIENYQNDQLFKNSEKRFQVMTKNVSKMTDAENAIKVIQIHGPKFCAATEGSLSNTGTVQAIVYETKNRVLHITAGGKVPVSVFGKWVTFEIEKLFD